MKRLLTAFLVLFSLQVNAQTFQEYTGGGLENRLRYTSTDSDLNDNVINNVVLASAQYVDPPEGRPFYYQLNQIGNPLIWAEIEGRLSGTGCTSSGAGCSIAISKLIRSSDCDPNTAACTLPDFGGQILAGSSIPVDRLDLAIGGCDIVLLCGQSNMVGWQGTNGSGSNTIDPVLDAANPYIYQWSNASLSVVTGTDPLEHPDQQVDAIGLGMTFAKSLLSFNTDNHYNRIGPVRPICLLPCGFGATGITSRTGGASAKPRAWNDTNMLPPDGGFMYEYMYDNTLALLNDKPGNRVVAILWHQGEEDARSGNAGRQPEDWSTDVADMFTTFRASIPELNTVPIIYGELTDFTSSDPSQYPDGSEIQAQINGTSATNPTLESLLPFSAAVVIDTLNPLWKDGLHFSDEGYRALGQLYFDAYVELTGQTVSSGIPGAPQNVNATVTGDGLGTSSEVDVCWNALTANPPVLSYTLYDTTTAETQIEAGITATCASTITGLSLQASRTYQVSATNALGEGSSRGEVSLNTGDIPQAFTLNTPTLPSAGQVDLVWTDPLPFNSDTPLLGCTAQYKLTSEPTVWTDSATGEVAPGVQTDLISGLTAVSHDFRVSCRSGVGPRLSNVETITPTGGSFPPPAPGSFVVTNAVGGFDLTWTKPTGNPDVDAATPSYRIYQQDNGGGGFVEVQTVNINTFTTISSGINTTDSYEFQVAGDNSECVSQPGGKCDVAQSASVSLNVPPVADLVATSPVIDEVQLDWTALSVVPACDASGNWYKIQRQVNGGGYSDLVEVTAITYTDTTVTNGNDYQYQVRCINGNEDANSYAQSNVIDPVGPGSNYANTWGLSGLKLHVQYNTESGTAEADKSLSCSADGNPCDTNLSNVSQWWVPNLSGAPAGLGYIDNVLGASGVNNPMQYCNTSSGGNACSPAGGMVATSPTNRHMSYWDGGSCTTSGCSGGDRTQTVFANGYYKILRVETFRSPMNSENFVSLSGTNDVLWIINDGSGRLCMGGQTGGAGDLCSISALPVGVHAISSVHNGQRTSDTPPNNVPQGQLHVYDISGLSDTVAPNCAGATQGTLANPTVLCTNAEGGYWAFETSSEQDSGSAETASMVISGWAASAGGNGNPSNGCDDCYFTNIILGTDGGSILAADVGSAPQTANPDIIEVIKEFEFND